MSVVNGLFSNYRMFGLAGVELAARSRLFNKQYVVTVATRELAQPVHLRLRTTDTSVFEEVVLNSEYELPLTKDPKFIVDAGANIGLTSVYFASRYPGATVVAIEPEPSNYRLLCRNASGYPNIVPLCAALWYEKTRLSLFDAGTGNWGFQIRDSGPGAGESGSDVQAITVASLMRDHGFDHIDVLKVDIEGAEKEVFEHCADWIDSVGVLMVELHDRLKPGCSEVVHTATARFPQRWQRGETLFFTFDAVATPPRPLDNTASPAATKRSTIIAASC
jgi:FkbM family methyltransferase